MTVSDIANLLVQRLEHYLFIKAGLIGGGSWAALKAFIQDDKISNIKQTAKPLDKALLIPLLSGVNCWQSVRILSWLHFLSTMASEHVLLFPDNNGQILHFMMHLNVIIIAYWPVLARNVHLFIFSFYKLRNIFNYL